MRSALPPSVRHRLKYLDRLRWLTKRSILHRCGLRARDHLGYVLFDPELESYSYDIHNPDEIARIAAEVAEVPIEEALAYVEDAARDPELTTELRRRTRWRVDVRTEPRTGKRLFWYVLVRARKPELVVETGILQGLGSLVLLRALAANAADGRPGRLVSVDVNPHSGTLVPDHLRSDWTKLTGSSVPALESALGDRRVDIFFHDTLHTEELQEAEFAFALRRAGDPLIIVEGSGGQTPTLRRLSDRLGLRYYRTNEEPVHFYPARGNGVAVVPRAVAEAWDGTFA